MGRKPKNNNITSDEFITIPNSNLTVNLEYYERTVLDLSYYESYAFHCLLNEAFKAKKANDRLQLVWFSKLFWHKELLLGLNGLIARSIVKVESDVQYVYITFITEN